jgi:NAD(P)-dependent dehydrogenase (short-subunit alcohol dehydrogenase family)
MKLEAMSLPQDVSPVSCLSLLLLMRIVYPSEMSSGVIEKIFPGGVFPKSFVPAEKMGAIEDMAGTILYLTSRAGAYLNGNVLVTDGGKLSIIPSTY